MIEGSTEKASCISFGESCSATAVAGAKRGGGAMLFGERERGK